MCIPIHICVCVCVCVGGGGGFFPGKHAELTTFANRDKDTFVSANYTMQMLRI